MKSRRFLIAAVMAFLATIPGMAQTSSQAQAVKGYLGGQRLLVTYRQGGPAYGTYFSLQVHLCRSGNYMTFGQSRKQTILGNEQINNWRDQGKWDVGVFAGQLGVQYVSMSGQTNFVPIRVMPNGSIQAGNGLSVVRQGNAQCP